MIGGMALLLADARPESERPVLWQAGSGAAQFSDDNNSATAVDERVLTQLGARPRNQRTITERIEQDQL